MLRTDEESPATREGASRPAITFIVVALLSCAASRLWYLASDRTQFNADEATTGVMVRSILHGHHFVFYAGQDYGGTAEQYLQAATYLALRLPPTPLTLRLTQVALSLVTCWLVYLVGGRVLKTREFAAVAALLFAISPWFNVIATSTSQGFYVAGQTFCMLTVYCALRLTDSPDRRRWLLGTGFAAGLALWTTVTSLYFLVPALVWVAPSLRRSARRAGLTMVGFAVGGSPLIGWLAVHRTLPLPADPSERTTVADRLKNLFGIVGREYLGVTFAHGHGGLPLLLQIVIMVGAVSAYLVAVVRRRLLLGLVGVGGVSRQPIDLLLALAPVVVVLYAATPSTWYTGTPRYLLITYPAFAIGLAASCERRRATGLPLAAAVVATAAILSVTYFQRLPSTPSVSRRDAILLEVTNTLVARHETDVYAGYWTAMPLQYVAGGRLDVAVCIGARRFPATQREVAQATSPVYVSSSLDGPGDPVGAALRARKITYRTTIVGFVFIYDDLKPPG